MIKLKLFFSMGMLSAFLWAQSPLSPPGYHSMEPGQQDELSETQRQEIWNQIHSNIEILRTQGNLLYDEASKPDQVLLSWPLEISSNSGYLKGWGISNHVDQQAGNGILDYGCGNITYNGHKGNDIFLWPFPWLSMDMEYGKILAAADGQIIYKQDGNQDRSCEMDGSQWNAVYLQHSDGSISWYGHMKKNSLTAKNVGDSVSEGEFLGYVGSSGNSTGPHLHLEVYDADQNLIEPFEGDCNFLNSQSWWQDQPSYYEPQVNSLASMSAAPIIPECPQQEQPNYKTYFDVGEKPVVFLSLVNQLEGDSAHLRVIKPDGTAMYDWTNVFTNTWTGAWWYWTLAELYDVGEYKWEVTLNGETHVHKFFVGVMDVRDVTKSLLQLHPNPAKDKLNIQYPDRIDGLQILDLNGRLLMEQTVSSNSVQIDVSRLPAGTYIIRITSGNKTESIKFLKE